MYHSNYVYGIRVAVEVDFIKSSKDMALDSRLLAAVGMTPAALRGLAPVLETVARFVASDGGRSSVALAASASASSSPR